jgi:monoamine oxidase
MNRKEFMQKGMVLGMGLPFLSSLFLKSCDDKEIIFPDLTTDFKGKVIIVGAGAAGLAAGYLLKRYGVDFEIIEAAPQFGGRLKRVDGFADFPIDLGAEWIHTDPSVLASIINDPQANHSVDVVVYNPQTIKTWNNGRLSSHNYIRNFYSEWKFKNTTWHGFFEQFILPHVSDRLVLDTPIVEIDHSADKVVLSASDGRVFEADKVLITVPVKVLQRGQISFNPALPSEKTQAFDKVFMGDGIKIFVEFKERFYPDILAFGNIFSALSNEEKFVYDAAFRKESSRNILGLFAINEEASAYTRLGDEPEIISGFLAELDEIFDGRASEHYVKHVIQNWSADPHIGGAYSYSFDGNQRNIVAAMKKPVSDKLYFAGEALSLDHQAMVQGACESAYATVAGMLQGS